MTDYLEVYEKFKDIKDISDYLDDVKKLRQFYRAQQYDDMQNYIMELTKI